MSELDINPDQKKEELDTLKARATTMGIDFHPNIGLTKLKEKIQTRFDAVMDQDDSVVKDVKVEDGPMTEAQYAKVRSKNARKTAGALVRIQVTCMNPDKKKWKGEIFSVGSSKIGTFKKFVPFGIEAGYHVPQIILDMMKERQFSMFKEVPGPKGNMITKSYLVPEFAIAVLPQLTTAELKDLANQQAASGSVA